MRLYLAAQLREITPLARFLKVAVISCAMRAALLALLAAALLALAPGAAHADDPPPQVALRLTYILGPGAENCPPEQVLHDEVARRMGYDPFTADAPDRIVANLNRSGPLFSGTLELIDSSGKSQWKQSYAFRGKKDEDCAALDVAMAIDISIEFIHFSLPSPAAAPNPSPSSESPPAEAPVPPPQPVVQASPPPPQPPAHPSPAPPPRTLSSPILRPRFEFGAGPLVAAGIAPGINAGILVHAGLRWPSLSLGLEGRSDFSVSGELNKTPPAVFKIALLGGSFVTCFHWRFAMGCGVVTAGGVHNEAVDIPTAKQTTATDAGYVGIGVRGGAELSLAKLWQPLAIRVHGDALFSALAARTVFRGANIWQTRPMSFSGGLTLLCLF
jgi:hypothetical protein